jgi:glycosyltransferase involved in cell wall biosynthesis
MKKIAIIAFGHPESSLPLTKHISLENNYVDYYYICYTGFRSVPGFDFGGIILKPGLTEMTPKRIPGIFRYLNNSLVKVFVISLIPVSYLDFINKVILRLMGRIIRKKKYDVVNFIGHNPLLVNLHESTKGLKKLHTLHEVNDHFSGQGKYDKLIRYLIENKIKIIVPSRATYDRLTSLTNCNKDEVKAIPFGIFETYRMFENGIANAENVFDTILFYGWMAPYKGLNILTEAVQLLKKRSVTDFNVIIAGYGEIPDKGDLEKDKTYKIINRHISNDELVALHKQSKFIVCPYLSASQSGIVMTAFLFSRPVIASDVGAFKETITDNFNGLLVPPNSPEELADAIFKLLKDNNLYEKLSYNAGNFNASSKFNWEKIARLTLNTYFKN